MIIILSVTLNKLQYNLKGNDSFWVFEESTVFIDNSVDSAILC